MRKRYSLFLLVTSFWSLTAAGQVPDPKSFGGFEGNSRPATEEISPGHRKALIDEVRGNVEMLQRKGIIKPNQKTGAVVKFITPLRQAAGFNEPGFYGISNYIDTNLLRPGIKDYNCGTRTYQGHYGTDYFTSPFPWKKMEENAVEVVAAADGVIITKHNGNDDKVCTLCPAGAPNTCFFWNAVYLQHVDGTITWYGHLKNNSLTSKPVGALVTQGEYLGVVGSSGNSSGPHLHFEVWNDVTYTSLVDPWEGPCNPDGNASYWQNQEPYYTPMVNKVTTASGIPTPYSCYNNGNGEKPLLKDTFTLGQTVYFPVYVRDNIPGRTYKLKLTRPGGAVVYDWTLNTFNQYYPEAYFYYMYNSSVINQTGNWKFRAEYENNAVEHTFVVVSALPLRLLNFAAQKFGAGARLDWQTTEEVNTQHFEVERSSDGVNYKQVGRVSTKGNSASSTNAYFYNDGTAATGTNYYRLKMVDKDGNFTYSNVSVINTNTDKRFSASPNPATSIVYVRGQNIRQVHVINNIGGIVLTEKINNQSLHKINVSHLAKGLYNISIIDKDGLVQTEKLVVQ